MLSISLCAMDRATVTRRQDAGPKPKVCRARRQAGFVFGPATGLKTDKRADDEVAFKGDIDADAIDRRCAGSFGGDDTSGHRVPHRGGRPRPDRMGEGRKDLHAGQCRQHEAVVEAEARQPAARDAQPVLAAHRRARRDGAGREGDRRRRRDQRRHVRHRRRDRTAAVAQASGTADPNPPPAANNTLCPSGQTAVPTMAQVAPGKYTVYAVSWDGRLRQINAARRRGCRAGGEIHPRRRQALRAESVQRRHLHRDGAGLRRADQRLLLLRSRSAQGERVHSRRRRPVGPARRLDLPRRHRLSRHRRRAVRSVDPAARQRDRRREDRCEQAAAAGGLLRCAERQLAVSPRPRRQRDAGAVRPSQSQVPGRHEQGMPALAARSRRARRRGSPHDAAHHAAALQRRAGVRRQGRSGAR